MSMRKPVGGGGNAGTVQRWRLFCLSRTPTAAAKNTSFRKANTTARFSTDYLEPGHWPSDTEALEPAAAPPPARRSGRKRNVDWVSQREAKRASKEAAGYATR